MLEELFKEGGKGPQLNFPACVPQFHFRHETIRLFNLNSEAKLDFK